MTLINRYVALPFFASLLFFTAGRSMRLEGPEFAQKSLVKEITFSKVEYLDFRPRIPFPQMKNCTFEGDISQSNFEGRQLVNVTFAGKYGRRITISDFKLSPQFRHENITFRNVAFGNNVDLSALCGQEVYFIDCKYIERGTGLMKSLTKKILKTYFALNSKRGKTKVETVR